MEGRALSNALGVRRVHVLMRKTPVHYPIQKQNSSSTIIYLTVCTERKKKILDSDSSHSLLLEAWKAADSWSVGRYVIMPDHIHLFCGSRAQEHSLASWVKFWKSYCSKRWPNQDDNPLWQKSFWDTQLRNIEGYQQKWDYVKNNPVRQGLIETSKQWPYQGELNTLEWHD